MNLLLLTGVQQGGRIKAFLADRVDTVLGEAKVPGRELVRGMDLVAALPGVHDAPDGALLLERGFAPWGLGRFGHLWSVFLDAPVGVSLCQVQGHEMKVLARELVDPDPDMTLAEAGNLLTELVQDLFMARWDEISASMTGPLTDPVEVPGSPEAMDMLLAGLGPDARVADLRELGRAWRSDPAAFRRAHGLPDSFGAPGEFMDPEPPDGPTPSREAAVAAREAGPDDVLPNWLWINDPLTRKMFKSNDYVGWSGHVGWYRRMLDNPDMVLCMGEADGVPFGNVRFDRQEPGIWEISINLAPRFRGLGLGPRLLRAAMDLLAGTRPVTLLYSMAKKINPASIHTFAKAGMPAVEPARRYPSMDLFDPETEVYMERTFAKE